MTGRLGERSALVTGAASGIGAAAAQEMAREGAAVLLADTDLDGAARVAVAIVASGGRAAAARCDVSDPDAVAAAFDTASDAHGVPDILFNNAGITGPLATAPESDA